MVDREHPSRREQHRATVSHLLVEAGIRLCDLEVAPREVSASVAVLTAYLGEPVRGNVRVNRRPAHGGTDLWHADMGDLDCLDLAEIVEITLRGLGYVTERGSAVPNQVDFSKELTASAVDHP